MKRAIFCGLLAALALSVPARAERSVRVQVDGQLLPETARLEQGTTYFSLRSLLDAMGGWTLVWDSGAAVATGEDGVLTVHPGTDTLTCNGTTVSGNVYVEDGRTYVPLRTTVQLLGGDAQWDPYLDGAAVTTAEAEHGAVDLYWLSRIISAESRGEPMEGQIAVGNVVLNRVASKTFPDTIPTVVFDRQYAVQFEPVSNGTVYDTPAASSVEAARRVLNGEKTVEGALYFYAPALSPGTWIVSNRTYLTTIGCHRFFL